MANLVPFKNPGPVSESVGHEVILLLSCAILANYNFHDSLEENTQLCSQCQCSEYIARQLLAKE